jgi:hypothetical protein
MTGRGGRRALIGGLVALGLAGCGGPPPGTLAVVNGVPINTGTLTTAVRATDVLQGVRLPMTPGARRAYLTQLINDQLVLDWARRHHVGQHSGAAVDTFIRRFATSLGGTAALDRLLAAHQLTRGAFRGFLARQYTLTAVFNRQTAGVKKPALSAAQHYYATHRALFTTPAERLAREIAVRTAPTADSVVAQLRRGASFAALARRMSLDRGSAAVGGSLGWVVSGPASGLPGPVYRLLDRLRPGQYGIARTGNGYAIVEVQAVRPGHVTPFATVAAAIQNQLWVTQRDRAFQHFVNGLRAHAQVVRYLR